MRIGVVGLGFMGSTHLKALRSLPRVQLVAVSSADDNKLSGDLSGIQGNLGGPGERFDFSAIGRYRDWRGLLADQTVDAVDICLPTHFHAEVAVAAFRAGKHVLVEKPMALDGASADAMIASAAEYGRILMAAQVLRFFPSYLALRDVLSRLGPVHSAVFRRRCAAPAWSGWLADRSKSGGGVFDLLIHDADMCLHLFGKPDAVSATGHEDLDKGIDTVTAQLHYDHIGSVTITGGWHHPKAYPFSMEYTVTAEGGTIEYSSAGRAPTLYSADGSETALPLEDRDGYAAEIEYFAECCEKNRRPEICTPEDSAAAVRLTLLIRDARKQKGEKIECKF